jgi:hypothetical protein
VCEFFDAFEEQPLRRMRGGAGGSGDHVVAVVVEVGGHRGKLDDAYRVDVGRRRRPLQGDLVDAAILVRLRNKRDGSKPYLERGAPVL